MIGERKDTEEKSGNQSFVFLFIFLVLIIIIACCCIVVFGVVSGRALYDLFLAINAYLTGNY